MKKFTLLLIFFFFFNNIYAQISYYKTANSYLAGVKIADYGNVSNATKCIIEEKRNTTIFTPYEVVEYGLSDGRVYISKSITIDNSEKKVFLLRLVHDSTSLYVYYEANKKYYYIEKDSVTFIELSKYDKNNNFREVLLKITDDCQNVKDAIKVVGYTNNSLSKFISNYNSCKPTSLPFFKFGLLTGLSVQKLEALGNNLHTYLGFTSNKLLIRPLPGIFLDFPVATSDFSFHADVFLLKYGYSFSNIDTDINANMIGRKNESVNAPAFMRSSLTLEPNPEKPLEYINRDFVANITSLNIPLLIRYTLPLQKKRPYINAGISYAYNFQNNTQIYNTLVNKDFVQLISIDNNTYVTKNQFGITIGGGLEYKINYKNSLFFELRYNKQINNKADSYLKINQLQFFSGYNF